MSLIDVIVFILTILLVGSIAYFTYIRPIIRKENRVCASCPVQKRRKGILKKYHKCNCCKK